METALNEIDPEKSKELKKEKYSEKVSIFESKIYKIGSSVLLLALIGIGIGIYISFIFYNVRMQGHINLEKFEFKGIVYSLTYVGEIPRNVNNIKIPEKEKK